MILEIHSPKLPDMNEDYTIRLVDIARVSFVAQIDHRDLEHYIKFEFKYKCDMKWINLYFLDTCGFIAYENLKKSTGTYPLSIDKYNEMIRMAEDFTQTSIEEFSYGKIGYR